MWRYVMEDRPDGGMSVLGKVFIWLNVVPDRIGDFCEDIRMFHRQKTEKGQEQAAIWTVKQYRWVDMLKRKQCCASFAIACHTTS